MNSLDMLVNCVVVDEVLIWEGDVVFVMLDGVIDNLWVYEIVEKVSDSVEWWERGEGREEGVVEGEDGKDMMGFVVEELKEVVKVIVFDFFVESLFMEYVIEEGLVSGGGKFFGG